MTQFFHLLNIIYEKISRTSRIFVFLHLLPLMQLRGKELRASTPHGHTNKRHRTRGGKPPMETLAEIEILEMRNWCDAMSDAKCKVVRCKAITIGAKRRKAFQHDHKTIEYKFQKINNDLKYFVIRPENYLLSEKKRKKEAQVNMALEKGSFYYVLGEAEKDLFTSILKRNWLITNRQKIIETPNLMNFDRKIILNIRSFVKFLIELNFLGLVFYRKLLQTSFRPAGL